jgi:NAD(P)-dependent dehydrogenase (short-subunit alcohol dehydrogenase family)
MTDAGRPVLARWHVDLPDLSGRRALVTGASDGVGAEIARALAGAGAHVVMPVRSRAKAAVVAQRILAETPDARLSVRLADLSSLGSVDGLVRQLLAEEEPIDMLVLNAGIVLLGDPARHVSTDGFELHLQTNALSHVALTAGILPLLRARGSRVAVQCSLAVKHGTLAFDDLQVERGYRPLRAYTASKVALGLFAVELARRSGAGDWGVRVALCHPGIALTNIAPAELRGRRSPGARLGRALMERGILSQSAGEAALPALLAVTSPDVSSGELVVPSGAFELHGSPRARKPYRSIADPVAAARAWDVLTQLAGARFPAEPGTPPLGPGSGRG